MADGTLKVGTITTSSGSGTITLGQSGETITIPSGVSQSGLGITEADQWRLTADVTTNTDPISANIERVDDSSFAKIGTGMSVSSGTWSFPSTGLYLVKVNAMFRCIEGDFANVTTKISTDSGSNYDNVIKSEVVNSGTAASSTVGSVTSGETFVNVTNISTHKLRFSAESFNTGTKIMGSTDENRTFFTFIRLGDSQ